MTTGPDFGAYLLSKKIDSTAFQKAEPELWDSWRKDFEQMHPRSFTVQKLNLINPMRRKYHLVAPPPAAPAAPPEAPPPQAKPVARPGRPVMKPRQS